MGFTDKFGNAWAFSSTLLNCFFVFMTGEHFHLFAGAVGLVFTGILNLRRVIREINQFIKLFKAKDAKEVNKLLSENLEDKNKGHEH
jgi:hypothetical protein